jgi:hypothetical protein
MELFIMSDDIERLVPDPEVAREFGVTTMSMWRWDHDEAKAALGWPSKIKNGNRNYRSRNRIEAFKKNLMAAALGARASREAV